MSSYAELLEEFKQEEILANETFSSLASYLESVTDFVNEEVDFNVTISLEEAVSGEIKDKAAKISASAKKAVDALIAKLEGFVEKVKDALKKYVAKAKATIANKGNEAMKKVLASNEAKLGKEIKLQLIKPADLSGLYKKLNAAADNCVAAAKSRNGEVIVSAATKGTIKAFSADISAIAKDETKNGDSVKAVYNDYVGNILEWLNAAISILTKKTDEAQKCAKEGIKELKKIKDEEGNADTQTIARLSDAYSCAMKISTYAFNFMFGVLTIATKNSAKIALAAVDAKGNSIAKAVKAGTDKAKDTVKGKATEVADKVKEKLPKKGAAEEQPEA